MCADSWPLSGPHLTSYLLVMHATISIVDLCVMAYAWSSNHVVYMVPMCRELVTYSEPYISCCEDEYANLQEIPSNSCTYAVQVPFTH